MATIIELGDGSFIAGDPPEHLDLGEHWCEDCGGSGLGWDYDDGICMTCWGRCVRDCEDTGCTDHSSLHPLLTERQAEGWACVVCSNETAAMLPVGIGPRGQIFACEDPCAERRRIHHPAPLVSDPFVNTR